MPSSSSSYTPISTASGPADLSYISRAKQRVYSTFATRRPWAQIFALRSLSFPRGVFDFWERVRTNLGYFRVNFILFILLVLFLALLWHPISLLVFLAMMVAWLFLYFLRDQPLVVFGRSIDDRIILAALAVLTLVFLFLTSATANVLLGLVVGVGAVLLYSAFRRTDDLFVDEEAATAAGVVGRSTAG